MTPEQTARDLAETPDEHQLLDIWLGNTPPPDPNVRPPQISYARRLTTNGIILQPGPGGTYRDLTAARIADRYATPQEAACAAHVWPTQVTNIAAELATLGIDTPEKVTLAYAICDAHLHQDLYPDPCDDAINTTLDITGN